MTFYWVMCFFFFSWFFFSSLLVNIKRQVCMINILMFRCKLEVTLMGCNPSNGNQYPIGQLVFSQPESGTLSKEMKIWRDMLAGRSTNLLHWIQLHEPTAWAFFFLSFFNYQQSIVQMLEFGTKIKPYYSERSCKCFWCIMNWMRNVFAALFQSSGLMREIGHKWKWMFDVFIGNSKQCSICSNKQNSCEAHACWAL